MIRRHAILESLIGLSSYLEFCLSLCIELSAMTRILAFSTRNIIMELNNFITSLMIN